MPNQELTQITNKINEFQELIKKSIPTVRERKLEGEGWERFESIGSRCEKCGMKFTAGIFGDCPKVNGYRGKQFCLSCSSEYGESTLKAEVDLPLTRTLLTQTRSDYQNALTAYQNEIRNEFDSVRRFINDKITALNYELGSLQNLQREYGRIERERNEWKRNFDNKNIENEANKQQLEQEKRNRQNEVVKHANEIAGERLKSRNEKSVLQIENTRLQGQLNSSNDQNKKLETSNKDLKKELEDSKKELNLVRAENTKLQLESSQKNSELHAKFKELKLKDAEIILLKNQAGLSQEELLKLKIRFEERNLEQFATELKINLEQLNSLSEFHEKLFTAHKEHNQDNVINQKANIAQIKQKLLEKGISITNIQEICDKCERIAQLNWELSQININQIQEKDWKNINTNFTPELVQEWTKHSFTYEQCQEWINISAPEKHNLVIKEPAYYAWLRDVKKMKPEEVLNYGDSQELNREYLKWYQEQEQQQFETKQEIPTNN